jgi:hypothetical protein
VIAKFIVAQLCFSYIINIVYSAFKRWIWSKSAISIMMRLTAAGIFRNRHCAYAHNVLTAIIISAVRRRKVYRLYGRAGVSFYDNQRLFNVLRVF